LLDDGDAAGAELPCLVGVVAEECDLGHAERLKHLCCGCIATLVRVMAQRKVGIVGVDAGVL
jgi:hypothetical protein